MHRLAGIVLKLQRAEQHLGVLSDSIARYVESEFYSTKAEIDRHRRIVMRIDGILEETRPEWSVLVGEVIYNFRSALDHLAYELAVTNHLPAPLPDDIASSSAFPIYHNGPRFRTRNRKGDPTRDSGLYKIRGCHRTAQAAIRRMQPYHRRKNPDAWTLRQLEELSNVDKHRTLHLTAAQTAKSRYGISGTGWQKLNGIYAGTGPFEPNAILAIFDIDWIDEPDRNVKVDAEIVEDITFGPSTPALSVRGQSVMGTLLAIRGFITSQVIPELIPLADPDVRVNVSEVARETLCRPEYPTPI